MPKKKIDMKALTQTLKIMAPLTLTVIVLGFFFGTILDRVFLSPVTQANNAVEATAHQVQNDGTADSEATVVNNQTAATDVDEDVIFVMQIGVFETLDNALALVGSLDEKGFTRGVNMIDGRFYVFSHIVGDRTQLEGVEEEMRQRGINPFVRALPVDTSDLRWYYFLKAVRQIPFEMESEFIQQFTTEELHIFGFYGALASVSFEPLCSERQELLLDIYNWLRD